MGDLCRLCCTTKYVNHPIFDDRNALYKKISQYLPIKAFKNDKLPQKICDSCCIKVHDFHQFYTKTLEVQRRLQLLIYTTVLPFEDPVTLFENKQHRGTQTDNIDVDINPRNCNNDIKSEPPSRSPSPVKVEVEIFNDDPPDTDAEDVPLINLKTDKKVNRKDQGENGEVGEKKRRKKKKVKSNGLNVEGEEGAVAVKDEGVDLGEVAVKQEPDVQFCCMCLLQCDSKEEMKAHYKEHGGRGRDKPKPPPPMPDARPLRCMRCKKVVEEQEWARHWKRHWERDRRPYSCVLCEMIFRDHKLIYKHGLTHKMGEARREPLKRFVCDLCPEAFVHMRWLLAHRDSAHPEAQSRALALRCAICEREFAHLNSLRRHLRAHSGERNFLCSVCGKALSSREHLKFHLRIHTGYKPHICKTCGKGFVKKCNLTLHERVHSGEKPHVCAHCGKAFSQRSTLVIHERYHSGARPYVCSLCGRGFVAKGLLSMHLKTTCIEAS